MVCMALLPFFGFLHSSRRAANGRRRRPSPRCGEPVSRWPKLGGRRGRLRVIEALVPLARMFGYADKVRSLSQGRASSTMEPNSYAPAPPEVQERFFNPEGF